MKIEHITYDESRRERSGQRSSAPSAIETTTISSNPRPRPSQNNSPTVDDERPITMWPRTDVSPPEPPPEMTTFVMLERRLEKEARETQRATGRVHFTDEKSPKSKPASMKPIQPPPPLRRKPNFSETLRECLRSPKSANETDVKTPKMSEMSKFHVLRERMREGKLEKAIPPAYGRATEGRLAPPQSRNPALQPPPPGASRSKKRRSAQQKISNFIDSGADVLDETRRDLSGKFLPPFENLSYPSFPRFSKKSRRHSDASDISFCCVGDNESAKEVEASTKEVEALKMRQQQNAMRLSGEGANPWTQPPSAACRLCSKPGVRGVRGLCNDCETDFMRPTPNQYEFSSSSDEEDEIKPTPPLKDMQLLALKTAKTTEEVGAKCTSTSYPSLDGRERQKPEDSVKAELKMTGADHYPRMIKPAQKQKSYEAIVDYESDDDRYRSWQTPEMRAEYERTKSLFRKWPDCYEKNAFESFENEGRPAPAVTGGGVAPGTDKSTCSGFYGFYDELLSEHGAETFSDHRAR